MVAQNKNGNSNLCDDGGRPSIRKGNAVNGHSAKSSTKNNIPSPVQDHSVSLEPNSNETYQESDDLDLDLGGICEVVISLKCKQCGFLCNDNISLSRHIRQAHLKSDQKDSIEQPKGIKSEKISGKTWKELISDNKREARHGQSKTGELLSPITPSCRLSQTEGENDHTRELNLCSKESGKTDAKSKTLPDDHGTNVDDSSMESSYEDVFLCAECDIVFSTRESCCSHMHKVHGLQQFSAQFFQDEIISSAVDETSKASRIRKSKQPKELTPEAGSTISKRFRVTKGLIHNCSKCSIKFENVEVMKFHEKCHSTTQDISNKPSKTYRKRYGITKQDGKLEIDEIAFPKGFFCPVCESNGNASQSFSKWALCAWHLWKEHRIDCELYTCSVCKQFKSYYLARVKDHEQLHSEKAIYKCKTCTKSFKQLKQLRCHEKYHKENRTKLAPEEDSRWYTPKECPICKRVLSDSKCLKKHISAVHNKLKPFVCNICGHTSARKAELQLHIRQHTGEKPYKCTICPFQTGDHNSLRKHKLRHGDKRPYSCPYCDYRCIQSCAFKKHILAIHPGQDVVFLCQLCSHASVNETLFAAHQKEHCENDSSVISAANIDANDSQSSSTQISQRSANSSDSEVDDSSKMLSGDEESLDIIDNGGVTIPASPTTPAPVPESKSEPSPSRNGEHGSADLHTSGETNSTESPCELNTSQAPEILFEKPNLNGDSFTLLNSFVVVKGTDRSGESVLILEPCNSKPASSILENSPQSAKPLSSQVFCDTNSLQSVPSPKPIPNARNEESLGGGTSEYIQHQAQDMRGSDDTESSSEVITNPHQLIQNVQLTPLDLTGVFEQSNDEGMLERLLDMSGV